VTDDSAMPLDHLGLTDTDVHLLGTS